MPKHSYGEPRATCGRKPSRKRAPPKPGPSLRPDRVAYPSDMAGPSWLWSDEPIPDLTGRARRAVRWLSKLRLPEGRDAGRGNWLLPWQRRLVERIYGPVDAEGFRAVRTVFVLPPRGNGKTVLASALALLHLVGPESGAQVICAAASREHAAIAYSRALRMLELDPKLMDGVRPSPSLRKITVYRSSSMLRAVRADAGRLHGLSGSFVVADELHAWPSRDLWDALVTSTGKRGEPITFAITTAGAGRDGIAWELATNARKVERGEIDDPSFLPVLFEPGRGDDCREELTWRRVNPGLGVTRSLTEMRSAFQRARAIPPHGRACRQYYLNIWLDDYEGNWLALEM